MSASVRTVMSLRALGALTRQPECIWHSRMRQASPDTTKDVINNRRYSMTGGGSAGKCNVCCETKQTEAPTTGRQLEKFDNITLHIDMCGPIHVPITGRKSLLYDDGYDTVPTHERMDVANERRSTTVLL